MRTLLRREERGERGLRGKEGQDPMNWTQDGLVETRSPVKGSLEELKTAGSLGFTLDSHVVPFPAVPRRFSAAGVFEFC